LKAVPFGPLIQEGRTPVHSAPKTSGNHVELIYSKIGAKSRAGARLFAMQHGLLPEEIVGGPAAA
jgi:hypothetical protein